CGLRTFHPARGGEASGVLPGTGQSSAPSTRNLVRRATPFVAIAAIFAVQALAQAPPVVAFPLYLAVVLLVALQQNRAESIAVAALAAIAMLILPVAARGEPADLASPVLLGAVLLGVAAAMAELARRARATALETRQRIEALTSAEGRLRALFESTEVGLALADLDGRFRQVNAPLAIMLGRAPDALLRTPLAEVTAGHERAAVHVALGLLRRGDLARWDAQVEVERPDGATLPVALFVARLSGSAREPLLLVQAADASASLHADAVRDCAAAVRQVIVASTSLDQAMPELLEAFHKHLGWDQGRFWGIHASTLTDGSELVRRVWQAGVLAADEGQGRSAVAFPVIDGGEVVGVVELVAQATRRLGDDEVSVLATAGVEIGQFIRRSETAQALRRSEADHRAIFERSPIGIARISADGDLLEANPALLHMLEHEAETMRGTAWPDLMRAYDQAAMRQRKATFLAGITDGSSVQVRASTGAGRWLWLQLTATSIPDSSGRPEHVLLMIEDVTAVRETSDRLAEALEAQRDANSNLAKIDRTKSEFLSIVSHEFRTALTGIQGFSELIRDGGLEPDEVRAYGGYIFNDADRVNRLIGDMLDLDRMESGRMAIRTAEVDINDILMEAIARATSSAVTVEFKSDLDPRLPIVAGDRDRLIQVVSNLVSNAVKYSPEGGTVTLTSRSEGRFALISVTDTGIGIPADEIGHVFERFRRVRSGAAQSIPGTGLGLTIVKQIVEMHGGKIWVESAVGHGWSFHFTIPLAPEGAPALQLRHG
ncbi:MAG TPA: ATP-binding protein, partial [Candidatus Limnocylindrales bacterium]|nr:ATP-binding protein [Candidatus Limnocylindrales bacterium]